MCHITVLTLAMIVNICILVIECCFKKRFLKEPKVCGTKYTINIVFITVNNKCTHQKDPVLMAGQSFQCTCVDYRHMLVVDRFLCSDRNSSWSLHKNYVNHDNFFSSILFLRTFCFVIHKHRALDGISHSETNLPHSRG